MLIISRPWPLCRVLELERSPLRFLYIIFHFAIKFWINIYRQVFWQAIRVNLLWENHQPTYFYLYLSFVIDSSTLGMSAVAIIAVCVATLSKKFMAVPRRDVRCRRFTGLRHIFRSKSMKCLYKRRCHAVPPCSGVWRRFSTFYSKSAYSVVKRDCMESSRQINEAECIIFLTLHESTSSRLLYERRGNSFVAFIIWTTARHFVEALH